MTQNAPQKLTAGQLRTLLAVRLVSRRRWGARASDVLRVLYRGSADYTPTAVYLHSKYIRTLVDEDLVAYMDDKRSCLRLTTRGASVLKRWLSVIEDYVNH